MIYDSFAWKRELRLKRNQLVKNIKIYIDDEVDESKYHKAESAILYSAFIIRKLIESGKMTDTFDKRMLPTQRFKPLRTIHRLHNDIDEGDYDFSAPTNVKALGKDICNWLVHSYVLKMTSSESGDVVGFFVSSDYDRNKMIYIVDLDKWLEYMDAAIRDDIVELSLVFDSKRNDYVAKRKK